MGAKEFGGIVERRMVELGISQNRLASRLGELEDGRIFDATQVRLIREGRRRLDHTLVEKLITLLDIDPAEGWASAGLLPRGFTADHFRRLGIFAAHDLVPAGTSPGALKGQYVEDQAQVRGMGELIVFPVERRRHDRRQRPRYLELAKVPA